MPIRAPNPRLEPHWPIITLIAELGTKLLWYGNCDIKYVMLSLLLIYLLSNTLNSVSQNSALHFNKIVYRNLKISIVLLSRFMKYNLVAN